MRIILEQSSVVPGKGNFTHDKPLCLLGEYDLRSEIRKIEIEVNTDLKTKYPDLVTGNSNCARANLEVMNKERDCKNWIKWQPESSPKEHREMMDREWEKKNNRKWHFIDLGMIFLGNIMTGILVGIAVWLLTKH